MNACYRSAFLLAAAFAGPNLRAQDAPKGEPRAGAARHSFENMEPGRGPAGFEVAETAGAGSPASWRVEAADDAPDGRAVVAVQSGNSGATFNLLMSATEQQADLALAVWIRANTGKEDQGGGLVWRVRDADNYYIARWNPLEDNVRLYKVENGRRKMFESADVTAAPDAWHRLSVTMRGPQIAVALDSKEVIRWQDATFSGRGKIGLWTKADASSRFDLLEIGPAPTQLVSVPVAEAPTVDGAGDDPAWRTALPLTVPVQRMLPPDVGAETEVQIRSVHTRQEIYFLVRWRDPTRDDVAHKPWVWNATKGSYEEGPDREDMFSLAFEHTGEFDPDMLSGKEGIWDLWQWKATRTNPQGFAMDRTHRYSRKQPEGKAKEHRAGSASIWIARPEDSGDTVEKKQPAPTAHQGGLLPQYLPGKPSGSAADVRAKGAWSDGWWTLELSRELDTRQPDDTAFVVGKRVRMAVAAHDRTGDMDKASGAIELELESGKQ